MEPSEGKLWVNCASAAPRKVIWTSFCVRTASGAAKTEEARANRTVDSERSCMVMVVYLLQSRMTWKVKCSESMSAAALFGTL